MDRKGLPWGYIVPAIVVGVVIIGAVYFSTTNGVTSVITTVPTVNTSFPIPCLGAESTFLHIHPWLQIFVNGQGVTIPGGIGIKNPSIGSPSRGGYTYGGGPNSCFEPVHTHDNSGIIHIESPANTNYTLGQFFQIWASTYAYALVGSSKQPIVFSSTNILGFVSNATASVTLLVDGQKSNAYGSLVLNTLAYCNATNSVATSSPCYPTAAGGDPIWNDGTAPYPYGTGHTIIIEYNSTAP
jgi:hypothetical protein